jgi:hypothetical protein
MAHTLLTPTMITRKGLDILHSKLSFLGNVNRQYDDKFAETGAKIGTSLNIRMPPRYTVRTNATFAGNDHVDRSTPLSVSSQYGVDVSYTTLDLTMSLDDFGDRFLEPAMAQLASKIEGDAAAVAYKLVANYTNGTTDGLLTYKRFQQGGQLLTENLASPSKRAAILTPASTVEFLDATKALFHNASNLEKQFREGHLLKTGGFDVFESTLIPSHTTGSLAGSPLTTGTGNATTTTANSWVSQTAVSITGQNTGTTVKAGDILTFGTLADGFVDVHPETKVSLGRLKRFVVQADQTLTTQANTYDVTVKPGIMTGVGNAFQNVSMTGSDTSGLTVTRIGAASSAFGQDLFFHEDAFVFATADLEDVSKYGANCARAVKDGISMRYAQQYAITSDTVATRFDILWGFAGLYPELAVRHLYEQDLL